MVTIPLNYSQLKHICTKLGINESFVFPDEYVVLIQRHLGLTLMPLYSGYQIFPDHYELEFDDDVEAIEFKLKWL